MPLTIPYAVSNKRAYQDFNTVGKKGDWVDLHVAETITLKQGQYALIPLGFQMKIPEGYEAHMVPRSSAFQNFGIIMTNSMAVVDNAYCGEDDWWYFPCYPTRDVTILEGTRICQFRIVENQPPITFQQVERLDGENRGGIGSTGR